SSNKILTFFCDVTGTEMKTIAIILLTFVFLSLCQQEFYENCAYIGNHHFRWNITNDSIRVKAELVRGGGHWAAIAIGDKDVQPEDAWTLLVHGMNFYEIYNNTIHNTTFSLTPNSVKIILHPNNDVDSL